MKKILLATIALTLTAWVFGQTIENHTNKAPKAICNERGHSLYGSTVFKEVKYNPKKGVYLIDYDDSTVVEEYSKFTSGVVCVRCLDTIWSEKANKKAIKLWNKTDSSNYGNNGNGNGNGKK